MTSPQIINHFLSEFQFVAHKFHFIDVPVSEASESKEQFIYHPGVYIFYNSTNVIKVGRNLTNSRKRALEHIRDNTKNEHYEMGSLPDGTRLLLINVKDPEDYHWVAAVEIFMERQLRPAIRSQRQ